MYGIPCCLAALSMLYVPCLSLPFTLSTCRFQQVMSFPEAAKSCGCVIAWRGPEMLSLDLGCTLPTPGHKKSEVDQVHLHAAEGIADHHRACGPASIKSHMAYKQTKALKTMHFNSVGQCFTANCTWLVKSCQQPTMPE